MYRAIAFRKLLYLCSVDQKVVDIHAEREEYEDDLPLPQLKYTKPPEHGPNKVIPPQGNSGMVKSAPAAAKSSDGAPSSISTIAMFYGANTTSFRTVSDSMLLHITLYDYCTHRIWRKWPQIVSLLRCRSRVV